MIIDNEILANAERRAEAVGTRRRELSPAEATQGVTGAVLATPRTAIPPVIEKRAENLSFAGSQPTSTEFERMMGTNDLVDEFYLERALAAAKPVCRVVVRNAAGRETGWATGFLVSPRVLITNWHVFNTAEEAQNGVAEFDYKFDIRGNPSPSVRFLIRPERFFYSNKDLDFALVAVEETSMDQGSALSQFSYHRLMPEPGKILEGEWITIIQHPGGQRRQFAIRENQLLKKLDNFLWYMSDTAQGSSGAPAFNDSFQVVALHHGGKAKRDGALYVLRDGRRVPTLQGIQDDDVVWDKNEGVRVSVMCADIERQLDASHPYVAELRTAIASEEGNIMAKAISGSAQEKQEIGAAPAANVPAAAQPYTTSNGSGLVIPLQLHVSLGYGAGYGGLTPRPPVNPEPNVSEKKGSEGEGEEKVIPPPVDTDYSNRNGYDVNFLSKPMPLPTIADMSVVAKLEDGAHVIPYEHFSLVLHKQRRLAIFTASNVDGTNAKRRPEPGLYTRAALFGLPDAKKDRESWTSDPRIRQQHQLPERFYDKDGGAFDKGHIVRREDVCWGDSRDQVVRANADSYHVTNCSPQVAGYNQSSKQGLWGLLENVVLDQATAGQKFTVIAGPILSTDDKVFVGKDTLGEVRIQIPRRFWKIVVAEKAGNLQAFAFVLEQELITVPLEDEEFQVTEDWTPYLVSIQDLENELGLVTFPAALKAADASSHSDGDEIVLAGKAKRRAPVVAAASKGITRAANRSPKA